MVSTPNNNKYTEAYDDLDAVDKYMKILSLPTDLMCRKNEFKKIDENMIICTLTSTDLRKRNLDIKLFIKNS